VNCSSPRLAAASIGTAPSVAAAAAAAAAGGGGFIVWCGVEVQVLVAALAGAADDDE